jgi:molybdopterin converting factor small subunit
VWNALLRDYPAIGPYAASMSCAVNADYARMTTTVHEGDEVAFLPPVSGG